MTAACTEKWYLVTDDNCPIVSDIALFQRQSDRWSNGASVYRNASQLSVL